MDPDRRRLLVGLGAGYLALGHGLVLANQAYHAADDGQLVVLVVNVDRAGHVLEEGVERRAGEERLEDRVDEAPVAPVDEMIGKRRLPSILASQL